MLVVGSRRTWLLCLALCALLVPAAAWAAFPSKGAKFEDDVHGTQGKDWHVQLEISGTSAKVVKTIVLYAEQCKATVAQANVPISDAGVVAAKGSIKGGGSWTVDGTFTTTKLFEGTARLTKGTCDTGPLAFKAGPEGAAHDDGAHTDDDGHDTGQHESGGGTGHGGGHGEGHGPLYPDFSQVTTNQMRQAVAMRRRAFVAARELFPTLKAALAQGYEIEGGEVAKRPVMFHVRNPEYAADKVLFNSRKPESLVYWRGETGAPVLVGFMFRAPSGPRPKYAGPIPIYHSHAPEGRTGSSQMTHVWLTNVIGTAWANCLPVKDVEAAVPAFRYTRLSSGATSTLPCPE